MKTPPHLLATLVLIAGCAQTQTPHYDMRFGAAVRDARQAMTLNPSPAPASAAVGLDGRAAHEAMVRWVNGFKAPPEPVNVININGGGPR